MKNPYFILDLWEQKNSLDDQLVKTAYLKHVQMYPPDREPERFQQIRTAYEQLETAKKRMSYQLFNTTLVDRDDLVSILFPEKGLQRPDLVTMQRVLKEGKCR